MKTSIKIVQSRTLELAIQRKLDLTVELEKIDQRSINHYGVDINGKMAFKSEWSDDDLFLDAKNKRYTKTTKNGITAMPGNGMSGTSTIFF